MKNLKMRLISVIILISIVTSFNVVWAEKETYEDVVNFYPYSSWATNVGHKYSLIFLEDNTRECKRYEIASLFYYILDLKLSQGKEFFNDLINFNDDLNNKINSVAAANIISGYNDGTFRPSNNVTRAEFVTMLDRSGILKYDKKQNIANFVDIENHWAKESIQNVSNSGVISGRGDNLFCPDDCITPQEILIILDRMDEYISAENIVKAMKNTFKCKQYSDKEKYIVEVMYSEFNEVQNFMNYAFPFKEYYDHTNWQNKLATHQDIQTILYFMMSYNSYLGNSGETKELYDNIGKTILSEKKSSGEIFTIEDFLYAVVKTEDVAKTALHGYCSRVKDKLPVLEFSNKDEFTDNDKELFRKTLGNLDSELIINNEMYFPLYAPITKYMLNYFAMKLERSYHSYRQSFNYSITVMQNQPSEYETDISKLPYNYYEYPYILKSIPKEIYEIPYLYSYAFKVKTPIECYSNYSEAMGSIGGLAPYYYNAILNVDYRTINEAEFSRVVKGSIYYIPDEEIKKYVDYVKENEIILEGSCAVIPGTMFLVDNTLKMRAVLKFKVISAKNNKNLLFGDLRSDVKEDIKYLSNEYTLYPDISVYRSAYLIGEKIVSQFKLVYEPTISVLNGYTDKYQLP